MMKLASHSPHLQHTLPLSHSRSQCLVQFFIPSVKHAQRTHTTNSSSYPAIRNLKLLPMRNSQFPIIPGQLQCSDCCLVAEIDLARERASFVACLSLYFLWCPRNIKWFADILGFPQFILYDFNGWKVICSNLTYELVLQLFNFTIIGWIEVLKGV